MEAASGSAIPTKLCVLDPVTPAKRHRAQQFTGGKNIGVPATLLETAFWEVIHPVNLTGNAQTAELRRTVGGHVPVAMPTSRS